MTVDEQQAADERSKLIAQLRETRAKRLAELARADEALAAAEDADFHARLGQTELKGMGIKEKAEVVSRIGYERFRALLGAR